MSADDSPEKAGEKTSRTAPAGPSTWLSRIAHDGAQWEVLAPFSWMRDCNTACAAGGPTISLALLVGWIPIREGIFISLEVIYALVLLMSAVFGIRFWRALGLEPGSAKVKRSVVAPLLLVFVSLMYAVTARWPLAPGSFPWWVIVFLGFSIGVLGVIRRHRAQRTAFELGL